MAAEPMVPGRAYWLKIGTQMVSASVARVDELVDVNTMARLSGRPLELNDIGRCEVVLNRPVAALAYAESRRLGGFILIDRATHATVAAGMVRAFPDGSEHQGLAEHVAGRIIWLTGSSPEEKRAFAIRAQERLEARGRACFILDDEALRSGLNSDLTGDAEAEHLRRAREVARLMSRAGVTVLVAVDGHASDELGHDVQVADAAADMGDWII
jgi:bifunctional enzyme CysN/CysC